jgi:hypothetical protein
MTDPDRVVVRSWIGAADGGYDPQKMAAQVTGDLQHDGALVVAQQVSAAAVEPSRQVTAGRPR